MLRRILTAVTSKSTIESFNVEEPKMEDGEEKHELSEDWMERIIVGRRFVAKKEGIAESVVKEIQVYQKVDAMCEKKEVVEWWLLRKSQLPLLYAYAMSVLVIQASEVSSERAFSWTGSFFTNGRARMQGSVLSNMHFVHANDPILISYRK